MFTDHFPGPVCSGTMRRMIRWLPPAITACLVCACANDDSPLPPLALTLDLAPCLGPADHPADGCRGALGARTADSPKNACLVVEQLGDSGTPRASHRISLRWTEGRLEGGPEGLPRLPFDAGDRLRAALFFFGDSATASCDETGPDYEDPCLVDGAGCAFRLRQPPITLAADGNATLTFRDGDGGACDAVWNDEFALATDEQCNGIDDDCDGEADEKLANLAPDCPRQAGVCAGSHPLCGGVDGWAICDDDVYRAHDARYVEVETAEHCDDLDNDCDGAVDEECECTPIATRVCGADTGRCVPGTQTCGDDGRWGPCEGETAPMAELCDGIDDDCDGELDEFEPAELPSCPLQDGICAGARAICGGGEGWLPCGRDVYGPAYRDEETDADCDGVDNDCDGETDERCVCVDGSEQPCGSSVGECRAGLQSCSIGAWGPCVGLVGPGEEQCNGLDDDCDGIADEAADIAANAPDCPLQLGACAGARRACDPQRGLLDCDDATYLAHHPRYRPTEDRRACDGIDNDCDGFVDEGCDCVEGETVPCGVDRGACTAGQRICVLGRFGACDGVPPSDEICDGIDNDCDGTADENVERPLCPLRSGVCTGARARCVDGAWAPCDATDYGALYRSGDGSEADCDTFDNDCDGRIDDGCACRDGEEQPCGLGVGACLRGRQRCRDGVWGACDAAPPGVEICNGIDDDCNGAVDDGLRAPRCPLQDGVCAGARRRCDHEAGWSVCTLDDYAAFHPRFVPDETDADCDALDNDCDGRTDEACDCLDGETRGCGRALGQCTIGVQTCADGIWGECDGVRPSFGEICDGVDEDCDGATDERADLTPPDCPLQRGVCAGAAAHCVDGAYAECDTGELPAYGPHFVPSVPGAPEARCDTLDNDCDGETDEGCDCVDGTTQTCGIDVGACTTSEQRCVDGAWTPCDGVGPTVERCNGIDDDCDGEIDEALDAVPHCAEQRGVCADARQVCAGADGFAPCGPDEFTAHDPRWRADEGPDNCDGLDNDCDGALDEACECVHGTVRGCGVDRGACTVGQIRCEGGRWLSCDGVLPAAEICNGIDDDCDDRIDEDQVGEACPLAEGVCVGAETRCVDGVFQVCGPDTYGPFYESDETLCDARDNDCDGATDEAPQCECRHGETRPCGVDIGRCQFGQQRCDVGRWGICVGDVGPIEETCDGVDEDCDGVTDEGTLAGPCANQRGVCAGAIAPCGLEPADACGDAVYAAHHDAWQSVENRCDGLDNDCDGETDEDVGQLPCYSGPPGTRDVGICRGGTRQCEGGLWSMCRDAVIPGVEICNDLDDDCDGETDEAPAVCGP